MDLNIIKNEYETKLNEKLERAEGLLCGLVLKQPEVLNDFEINKKILSENALFYIGMCERLLSKGIEVIDEVHFSGEVDSIGLKSKYDDLGGWQTIKELSGIANVQNSDAIMDEFTKWNLIKCYKDKGILDIEKHWDKLLKMKSSQVEDYMMCVINDVLIKSNLCTGLEVKDLTNGYENKLDEWDKGLAIGYKLGFPIINYTLCGLHRGSMSLLLAHSGNGKTTFAIPYSILPIIEQGDKVLILANEQNEDEWRQMILATVLFNKIKYKGMNRQKFLYGKFSEEDKKLLSG